jgi:hypothetical protein
MTPAVAVEGPEPPPPGPGVTPPFAAPPVDRSRRSLWIGLIAGGIALVLCCAGGLFGLGLVVVAGTNQQQRMAKDSVTAFLTAAQNQDFDRAYSLLCSQQARRATPNDIASEFGRQRIDRFSVGQARLGSRSVTVPAEVDYASGSATTYQFTLIQESAQMKICGWR